MPSFLNKLSPRNWRKKPIYLGAPSDDGSSSFQLEDFSSDGGAGQWPNVRGVLRREKFAEIFPGGEEELIPQILPEDKFEEALSYQMTPTEFAQNWNGSDFATRRLPHAFVRMMDTIISPLPDKLRDWTHEKMDDLTYLLADMDKAEKLKEATATTRRLKEKAVSSAVTASAEPLSTSKSIIGILILTGVIHGGTASIATTAGAAVVALAAWAAFIISLVNFARAGRMRLSANYWVKDLTIRYKKINKFLDRLTTQLDEYTTALKKLKTEAALNQDKSKEQAYQEKINKLEFKLENKKFQIKHWVVEQEKIKQNVIIIGQVKASKRKPLSEKRQEKFAELIINEKDQHEEIKKFRQPELQLTSLNDLKNKLKEGEGNLSPETKELYKQLKKNKRNDWINSGVKATAYGLIAIGATLTAISPAWAHAAPAVLAVGMGISIGGTLLLAGRFLSVKLVNTIATKTQYKKAWQAMSDEYHEDGKLKNEFLVTRVDQDLQMKYRLSYEYSFNTWKNDICNQGKTPEELETDWYKLLNVTKRNNPKELERLLETAYQKSIEERLLCKALKINPPHPNKEQEALFKLISNDEKEKIIKRECRAGLVVSMKTGFGKFFSKLSGQKNKEIKDSDRELPNLYK